MAAPLSLVVREKDSTLVPVSTDFKGGDPLSSKL